MDKPLFICGRSTDVTIELLVFHIFKYTHNTTREGALYLYFRMCSDTANINEKMGKAVLLVTHDPIIASYCKRILFIKDGELMEDLERTAAREKFYDEIIKRMKCL